MLEIPAVSSEKADKYRIKEMLERMKSEESKAEKRLLELKKQKKLEEQLEIQELEESKINKGKLSQQDIENLQGKIKKIYL